MSEDLGYQDIPEADRKKAEAFFKQGRTVAAAGQYEYAIEMYLSGLKIDPEAVAEHQNLREISLKRKASGGKDLGMMAKMKYRYGKDDRENLVTAERFLAYDPGNTSRMLELLQHALSAGAYETVLWIGPILLRANSDSGKPDINKYLALKDAYKRLRRWQLATEAAQKALQMRPEDMNLQQEVKNLGAMQTMAEGGYEKGGNFRDSIKDLEGQQRLMTEDTDIRSLDVLTKQILAAREELKKDPSEPGKVTKLVDVLVKTEDMEYENEAIQVLDEAYKRTNAFRFRLRIGQIKMAQMKRTQRWLLDQYRKNPNDAEAKKAYIDFVREKTEEELKEYTLAAENYPTDITLKYEMATRLFDLERYGEAIPLLQHAVQDPKIRIEATVALGRAFLQAEFVDEAVDTLKGLTETYQLTGDARAKEIWYWYGRTLESRDDKPDAIKAYSKVAMWDFNYRDVQQRLKRLRTKPSDE